MQKAEVLEKVMVLLPRLRARLEANVTRHVRNKVSLDDIVQETCRRAISSSDSFRQTDENALMAWLQRTAHRIVIDQIRKKQSHQTNGDQAVAVLKALTASGQLTPSRECSALEAQHAIHDALSHLEEQHYQIVQLRYVESLSFREIAERIGCSPSAVRGLHRTAIAQLRRHLGRDSIYFST